jgi:hypothetical protein
MVENFAERQASMRCATARRSAIGQETICNMVFGYCSSLDVGDLQGLTS